MPPGTGQDSSDPSCQAHPDSCAFDDGGLSSFEHLCYLLELQKHFQHVNNHVCNVVQRRTYVAIATSDPCQQ